jgi:hypothetical protein
MKNGPMENETMRLSPGGRSFSCSSTDIVRPILGRSRGTSQFTKRDVVGLQCVVTPPCWSLSQSEGHS